MPSREAYRTNSHRDILICSAALPLEMAPRRYNSSTISSRAASSRGWLRPSRRVTRSASRVKLTSAICSSSAIELSVRKNLLLAIDNLPELLTIDKGNSFLQPICHSRRVSIRQVEVIQKYPAISHGHILKPMNQDLKIAQTSPLCRPHAGGQSILIHTNLSGCLEAADSIL